MWVGVPPHMMCRQHLLGEHVELHMLASALKNRRSVAGYIKKGLLWPDRLRARHAALVAEMRARGYDHQSTLDFQQYKYWQDWGSTAQQAAENTVELARRCNRCWERQDR